MRGELGGFGGALAAHALVLAAAWAAGFPLAAALVPRGRAFLAERLGWALAIGAAGLALGAAAGASVFPRPSRAVVLGVLAALVVAGEFFARRVRAAPAPPTTAGPVSRFSAGEAALVAVAAAGVLLYALFALAEPMWSNDFIAIWGLKAKSLALSPEGRFPAWLRDPGIAGFSHPEYPLGLPLLFAGIAAVADRWEDQALALVYPLLQVATLLVLAGWLRRRGATPRLALAATALLALFEPLYSAFLTGLAEVPLALAVLLVGASLADALDGTDPAAVRRLAAAAFLAASVKNEGLYVAAVAAIIALASGGERRGRLSIAIASLLPAFASALLMRILRGPAPLRDFDFGLLAPGRWGELAGRLGRTLAEDARLAVGALPVLAAIAILFACGRKTPWADRLLVLALAALAAYLALPALAVLAPEWLVRTTLGRTCAALVPLAAAGLAGRLVAVYAPPAAESATFASER